MFDALIAQGLIKETGEVGAWDFGLDQEIFPRISSCFSKHLKGLKYKGGYHDVNDPGHPNYDPRGGGEGEQPWLYPQGGIASVDDTITQTASTDPSNLYAVRHYRVRPEQFRVAEGGRVPAAFGGIMDSETGRRGYGLEEVLILLKAVKKAVKSGIKGVKKLAKSEIRKNGSSFDLWRRNLPGWYTSVRWIRMGSWSMDQDATPWKPRNLGAKLLDPTSWDKAASLLSPGKPQLNSRRTQCYRSSQCN